MPKVKILSERPFMLSGDFRRKDEIVDVTEEELADLIDLDEKAQRSPRIELIKAPAKKSAKAAPKAEAPSFEGDAGEDS